ncbi:hypothetical protein D3C86_1995400 [compost metagenome]
MDFFFHGFLAGLARGVQGDHTISPATAPVNNRWRVGFLVQEQVEVVSDELHVVHGVIEGQRCRGENFPADQDG